MPVQRPRVLICGASVAGPVLAYWLHRFGFQPTVVERTAPTRTGTAGHAVVDLFGPAVDVVEWMGVLDQVTRAQATTRVIAMVRPGRRAIEVPADMASEGVSDRHLEIMRGELATILRGAADDRMEYLFNDSITAVQDDGSRVAVTFEHGQPATFDLLVGADACIPASGDSPSTRTVPTCGFSVVTSPCSRSPTSSSSRTG